MVRHQQVIDKPEAKSQSKAQSPKPQKAPKREKRNLASGLVTKILWATTTPPHPTHPQLLSMKEASSNKTQGLKVTQYDPLYQLSTKKQVDSKRENMDESNMFKENIIKEMF